MKKKLLALSLAACMALSLAACGSNPAIDPSDDGAGEPPMHIPTPSASASWSSTRRWTPPPRASRTPWRKLLGAENVIWNEQNAAGDSATCTTIVGSFVSEGVDLILANGTAALQAAAAATGTIPILGTSITEYGVALGIDGFSGTVGSNVSGTSDLAPLDQQAAMVKELFPTPRPWACSTAPPRPTASIRWRP